MTRQTTLDEDEIPLEAEISKCEKCPLHENRTNTVPGEGSAGADIMFIGEAPGEKEDKTGRPFVGRAGSVLAEMLGEAGLSRKDVFIANVIKCRPPDNRDPSEDEKEKCTPFLDRQIEHVDPEIIVTLGKHATESLLGSECKMTEVHGEGFKYAGKKLIPLFHPAVALYEPSKKELLLDTMKTVNEEATKKENL